MRSSRKFRALLIGVLVLVLVVGVLVWPTPKEARADFTYSITVRIWDNQAQGWHYMTWAEVRFFLNGDEFEADCNETAALAQVTVANFDSDGWEAEVSAGLPAFFHYVANDNPNGPPINAPVGFPISWISGTLWIVPDNGV